MSRLILALLFSTLIVSCKSSDVLRPDPYPATMDMDVYQTRLEFKGCGTDSIVGSIVCFPQHNQVLLRTEFPGNITLISKGDGCMKSMDVVATIPYTVIPLTATTKICSTSILYQPKFIQQPDMEIRGVFGELVQFPDTATYYLGTRSFNLYQKVELPLPKNIVRGWYTNRFLDKPVEFKGNVISYVVPTIQTDLIQIKGFDADNKPAFYLYTVNYYSPKAKNIPVSITPKGSDKVSVLLPDEVTIVSIEGQMEFWRSFNMSKSFVGIIRAYTVKGRTLVFKLNKGVIEWVQ